MGSLQFGSLSQAPSPAVPRDHESRRAFFRLDDEDLRLLKGLRGFAEKHTTVIVERFYEHLLAHPEVRRIFVDEASLARAKRAQTQYFVELFGGDVGPEYVENRMRVGRTHERIGVSPTWYLGAYAEYLRLIEAALKEELLEPSVFARAYRAIEKVVLLDVALAMETYVGASLSTLAEREKAIRELSTPVIRLHDEILLLPLIGALDSNRMEQLTTEALSRTTTERAKVVLIDVAGVPVIDTAVADALSRTTAALRLLGAEVIITGISPTVAQTLIGIEARLDALITCSHLAHGVQRALRMVGKRIESVR